MSSRARSPLKPRTPLVELARRLRVGQPPMAAGELPAAAELHRIALVVQGMDPRTPGFFPGLNVNDQSGRGEEYYLDLMELSLHYAPDDSPKVPGEWDRLVAAVPTYWPALILESVSSPHAFRTLQHVLQLQLQAEAPFCESPELEALERWALEVAAGLRQRPRRRGRPSGEASAFARAVITVSVNLLHDVFGRPYTAAVDTDVLARKSACQVVAERLLETTTDRVRTIWARGKKRRLALAACERSRARPDRCEARAAHGGSP